MSSERCSIRVLGLAVLGALVLVGCREGSEASASNALVPSADGAGGCAGPNQVFAPPQVPSVVPLAMSLGPSSQIAAARGGELLYATGANATLVEIDLTGGAPVERDLVLAGDVATFLATLGVNDPPELSGLTVLDATDLVVMEHAANVLLTVDRITPSTIGLYAGQPNATPGFADGFPARFAFEAPSQVAATGNDPPQVLVADVGNERIRLVSGGITTTLAGTGVAASDDGDTLLATFDAPAGMSMACDGSLFVTERGGGGAGERLRHVVLGAPDPFSGLLFGITETSAGGGAQLEGPGADVDLAVPVAPFVTQEGDVYWIDSGTGVLRRLDLVGDVDCPLAVDCQSAILGPTFTPGGSFSLAQTDSGVLYVLDATAGTLYRVTP